MKTCDQMGCDEPLQGVGGLPKRRRRTLCYYHEKVASGLLLPLRDVLSPVEIESTMGGRPRNDGRRLDHYVLRGPY